MFTGTIQEVGKVVSSRAGSLVIGANKVLKGVEPGGSVSVNGACLTVTRFNDRSFSVDVTPETLRRTNLGLLSPGDPVNLERPMALGGELGGHLVQGHVDGTGKLSAVSPEGAAFLVTIEAPPEIMRSNFAGVILKMLSLQITDIASFPFIDRPPQRSFQDGLDSVRELGAIEKASGDDNTVKLTEKGLLMARIPLDPRLARMLIEARKE